MNPYTTYGADYFDRYLSGTVFLLNGEVYKHDRLYYDDDDASVVFRGEVIDSQYNWNSYRRVVDITELEADNGDIIDITFPDMGYINYKKGVVFISRIPARQWHVAYNHRVVEISDPTFREREEYGIMYADTSNPSELVYRPNFVARLFNRYFFSYDQAIKELRNGRRLAAAITKHIAIAQTMQYPSLVIYYKDRVVGTITNNDVPVLFKEADYVAAACPFKVTVENDNAA